MSLDTGNNAIDALVYNSWTGVAGAPVTLTYSFLSRSPSGASADDRNGFRAMTETQQGAVREALAKWAGVANVTFEQVASGGNLLFGSNDQGRESSAYAYLPGTGVTSLAMYTNTQNGYNSVFTPGSYGPAVVVHEIGHLLGLKHPGDYDSTGGGGSGPFLPAATDNGDYTQMSYDQPTSWSVNRHYATTPMLYDIQAIQYLYGANTAWHAGDDVYAFAADATPQCIWDAGGNNTIDFSACTRAAVINLNAGSFSETAPGLNNLSIAYGVAVQGAIAGSGDTTMYANNLGNLLRGGAGTDVIHAGGGNDTIDGGAGVDTVVFAGSYARYTVATGGGGVTVSGDGSDTLVGVELLQFADRVVRVGDVGDVAAAGGTPGNDRIVAPAASVTIDGGAGLDTVVFAGAVADYRLASAGAGVTVGGNGVEDVLVNVERLAFADGGIALDLAGGGAGQLYRLYQAVFDRAPDPGGMGYWLARQDAGTSLVSIADGFVGSAEFVAANGRLDDAAYVTRLYQNVLDRAPDPGGFAWHVDSLAHGVTRAEALLNFSESAEFIAGLAPTLPVGVFYTV